MASCDFIRQCLKSQVQYFTARTGDARRPHAAARVCVQEPCETRDSAARHGASPFGEPHSPTARTPRLPPPSQSQNQGKTKARPRKEAITPTVMPSSSISTSKSCQQASHGFPSGWPAGDLGRHQEERTRRRGQELGQRLERLPYTWNHGIEKDSFKIKEVEHVLMTHRIYPMSKYRKSRATFLRACPGGQKAAWTRSMSMTSSIRNSAKRFPMASTTSARMSAG
jgi:hypothetical protein